MASAISGFASTSPTTSECQSTSRSSQARMQTSSSWCVCLFRGPCGVASSCFVLLPLVNLFYPTFHLVFIHLFLPLPFIFSLSRHSSPSFYIVVSVVFISYPSIYLHFLSHLFLNPSSHLFLSIYPLLLHPSTHHLIHPPIHLIHPPITSSIHPSPHPSTHPPHPSTHPPGLPQDHYHRPSQASTPLRLLAHHHCQW